MLIKKARSVLCLGPPHSGKSVFAYLLFKSLRTIDKGVCVMDADYYSPTYARLRVTEFASSEEIDCIIQTPNAVKLETLNESTYKNTCSAIHELIPNTGVIVIDGVGKHSASTESLMDLANSLIVLCPAQYDVDQESVKHGFVKDGEPVHPFDFYCGSKKNYIKILTHFQSKKIAYFNKSSLQGELFDLDRGAIKQGKVEGIPSETLETVKEIALFVKDLIYVPKEAGI